MNVLPSWALVQAGAADRQRVLDAKRRQSITLKWKADQPSRRWAKQQGWPTPWFGFPESFFAKMLESDENFALGLRDAVDVLIPKATHTISDDELRELDIAYGDHSWRWLVDALRAIRRAVEAGVVVYVENSKLTSFDTFYEWAHGRFHALEDDTNTAWVGDDSRHP